MSMIKKHFFAAVAIVVLVFTLSESVHAAWGRQGRAEFFAGGRYLTGDQSTGLGISIDIDDFAAGGFGLGYNINENFNLNAEMLFGSTDFVGRLGSQSVKIGSDVWIANFNLEYYVLKAPLTPMLTGGIGFMNFRGDHDSFEETDFSYNAGAGIRWDITNQFFLKATYSFIWTKLKDADNTIMFHGPSLNVGILF